MNRNPTNTELKFPGVVLSVLKDRFQDLASHLRGKLVMASLKLRHRDVVRDTEPLADYLEEKIFPAIRNDQSYWLILTIDENDSGLILSGRSERLHFEFPGTSNLAGAMHRMAVRRIDLDARLEADQITESLLMLIYAQSYLDNESNSKTADFGWSARSIASAMVHPSGFHKFCALMHFNPLDRSYKAEYSYCELFFSKIVKSYTEHSFKHRDHRRLFSAAPRAALLTLFILIMPMLMIYLNIALGMVSGLAVAFFFAGLLGFTIYSMGSIQYDREHRDILIQEFIRKAGQQEKELETINKRLEMMVRMKDDFLRIASHDLKNPLMVIRMAANLLSDSPTAASLPSDQKEKISMITRNTTQMQNIIEDFLDTQAMEDGQFKLAPERFDFEELLRQVLEMNKDYANTKGVELKLDIGEKVQPVVADPRRINQVLQNLIGNSIKFCSAGDCMTACCQTADKFIRIEIRDSGPGLTGEDMNHVFSKHSRMSSKPTGSETSSGLGLYICKQLVELHGGRIGVRNNDDRGATFWFELPRMDTL